MGQRAFEKQKETLVFNGKQILKSDIDDKANRLN